MSAINKATSENNNKSLAQSSNHSNDAFIVKKVQQAKDFIQKAGLPEQFVKK